MPGYRTIAGRTAGAAVDDVRLAEAMQAAGDYVGAAEKLEGMLEASEASSQILPGWLCGRLAVVYRKLARYEDEISLLERYEATQVDDDARCRFQARLSKARAIAIRKHKRTGVALLSIRAVMDTPREERKRALDARSAEDR